VQPELEDEMSSPTLVWFRQDLRLSDNPALAAAVRRGGPLVPVFILDDETPGTWSIGGAGRWWLHHSLSALAGRLEKLGVRLVLRRGRAETVLAELVAATGATAVYWNRCYEPWAIVRDRSIKTDLRRTGLDAQSFNGALLVEPWGIRTKSGGSFRVFTPFWRAAARHLQVPTPIPTPKICQPYGPAIESDPIESWSLLPTHPDWSGGLGETWMPGEAEAQRRLHTFLEGAMSSYASDRDHPGRESTSRLSPHLHWGEISPRQIWAALDHGAATDGNIAKFRSELGWREFSYHLLFHNPDLPDRNFREDFDAFAWQPDASVLQAWQRGNTGIPLIDAGMRQLWATGWMHNRVRMVAASFLVKHLLQPWQEGARWFWDTLVDADLANNSASWQWVAGCGADAAPYFRIFNPVLQGEKFDPDGDYVRSWVPELSRVPTNAIHSPWKLANPPADYPRPIINLAAGRRRALAAYEAITGRR
jgi:deoxyribodipyrimidine photo-lyase